jgi:uncharacterized protein with von Willebrand factor type A (vWA) domain
MTDTAPREKIALGLATCGYIADRDLTTANPMRGWQNYSPEARGMKAALPFIDLFAPAHNLESLIALEPYLARL